MPDCQSALARPVWRFALEGAIAGHAMTDRLFFPLLALAALALIAVALVWPQGMGRPSPRPFARPATARAPTVGRTAAHVFRPGA